jgi:hypothetical protein
MVGAIAGARNFPVMFVPTSTWMSTTPPPVHVWG